MSGRMTLGSLFVLAILIPGVCHAQGGYGYGPGSQPGAQAAPVQQMPPQNQMYPAPPPPSNNVYEELPDDLGFFHDDTPLGNFLTNTFRHAYFRGEYLLWNVTRPKDTLLGGQPSTPFLQSSVAQPLFPNTFTTIDPLTSGPANAIEPSTSTFDLSNLSGYRGTIGVPIGPGSFEVASFVLQIPRNVFSGDGLIVPAASATAGVAAQPGTYIGQPILVDGGAQTMLYTNSYEAVLKTSLWGAEANYIFNAPNAGSGDLLTISPLIGFRYLDFRESLNQSGVYQYLQPSNSGAAPVATAADRSINSFTNNNTYGPQIGIRTQLAVSRVTLGVEPKIMFGVNTYSSSLSTLNVPLDNPANNVNYNFQKSATVYSPIADLKVYSRIQVSQYVNVFVAYNMMWVGNITRPSDNIGYNITSSGAGLFGTKFSDATIQGLSVGGEIRY